MNGNVKEYEQAQLAMADSTIAKVRSMVKSSVRVTDNVTLHVLDESYPEHVSTLVHTLTELQTNYPAPGKVEVFFPSMDLNWMNNDSSGDTQTQAATIPATNGLADFDGDDRVMLVSPMAFPNRRSYSGFHMPAFSKIAEGSAVVVHEWGHVFDNRKMSNAQLMRQFQQAGIMNRSGTLNPLFFFALSDYGRSSESEGFAEAFVEWAVTGGNTDNFAAKWYAREYNWPWRKLSLPRVHSHQSNYSYGYQNHGW